MKRDKISKEDMLFSYQNAEFPMQKLSDQSLNSAEYLFNEEREDPELLLNNKKKVKYSTFYVVEEELEPNKKDKRSGGGFNRGANSNYPSNTNNKAKPNPKANYPNHADVWKKPLTNEEDTGDFFDNFKGKSDKTQVEKFIKEKHLMEIKLYNYSIESNQLQDSMNNVHSLEWISKSEEKISKLFTEQPNKVFEEKITVDNLFDKADLFLEEKPIQFSIKLLYSVNYKLEYPKGEPLWYIYHEGAKSSFGPLSSKKIEEMFNKEMLSETSKLRLIDVYNIKNKRPFEFFELRDLTKFNFIDTIEVSPLSKLVINIEKQKSNHIT